MRFSLLFAASLLGCEPGEAPIRKEPPLDPLPDAGVDASKDPPLDPAARAKLDAYLAAEHASHGYPAMAVGVVFGDRLVYDKGLGARDGAKGTVDAHTVFRIGSVTKVMTGVVVLQHRDRKELGLDDPVDKYIPELTSLLSPAGMPKVTLRHLVTHTSGIPSIGDGKAAYWKGDRDVTESELFASLAASKLEFPPGSAVKYSNFAVALAGIVVARISKESFRDVVEGALFEPLGIVESTWERTFAPSDRLAAGRALSVTGYVEGGPHWRLGAAEAAGGLYSTVSDVARFLSFEARAHSELADHDDVLSRASLRESQTSSAASPFGVGWLVGKDDLGSYVTHDGSIGDYSASVKLYPVQRAGIVALLATGDAEQLDCIASEALRAALQKREPKPCVPRVAPWNQTALDRVKALFAKPDAAQIDAAFSPTFPVSREELLKFFESCNATYGACTAQKPLATSDSGTVRVRLTCDKGAADVLIGASRASSLVETLYVAGAK